MLTLENIRKGFTEPDGTQLPILDIPHFAVEAGEQMVLVGRSGCGKTTFLHVIAGITTPDAGRITIDGIEMTGLSEGGRDRCRAAKLGYVFQTFNLLPGFTALENVLLGMTFARGEKTRRARICSTASASRTAPRIAPANFRWGSSSESPSRECSPTARACYWPMNRPPMSILRIRTKSSR